MPWPPYSWGVPLLDTDPPEFRRAARSLAALRPRPELEVSEIRPPQRLAPWCYALGAELAGDDPVPVSGRLVLLHDPDAHDAWDGTLRLVVYLRAELDTEVAGDPLLPEVGWSWLTEALDLSGAAYLALGGTVTQTSSARFGDIAGPVRTDDLELRASWTPLGAGLGAHGEAFCALIATAAGLPPVGVAALARGGSG